MTNLDLYARIEPMIGFYEAYEKLYDAYMQIMQKYKPETVLDVGCGNGKLLLRLVETYKAQGIDISPKMVEIACARGLPAKCCYLHETAGTFDMILAVADVLNYMTDTDLEKFLEDVASHLSKGGIFICDINTLHGFEDVAAGSMNVDEGVRFLAIDAEFENSKLQTDITYFEQNETGFYTKEQATIVQYYHSVSEILSLSPMKLIANYDISLFSMESDKTILVFQK